LIRNKQHVIVATPTASSKSLIYNLPVLERFQNDNNSKSLYINFLPACPG
jgi:DEAD/DEAH box helicase domain-containing protein